MSKVFSTVFGGGATRASKKGQEAVLANNRRIQQDLEQREQQSRQDILALLGGSIPAQLGAFQGGNVAAQGILGQTLPQFQNALLGLPVDFSTFQQPQTLPADLSFLQNFQQPQQQNLQQPQQNFQQPQGGFGIFGGSGGFGAGGSGFNLFGGGGVGTPTNTQVQGIF